MHSDSPLIHLRESGAKRVGPFPARMGRSGFGTHVLSKNDASSRND